MKKKITWIMAVVVAASLVIVGMAVARDARLKASDENVYEEAQTVEATEEISAVVAIPRSVRVRSSLEGMTSVEIGTQVTLTAELVGFENVAVNLQWQSSEDGEAWKNLENENGFTYEYLIDENNYMNQYRVMVDVIDEEVVEEPTESEETVEAEDISEVVEELHEAEEMDEEVGETEEIIEDQPEAEDVEVSELTEE